MPNYDIRAIYMERALQAEHWAALFAEGYFRNSWLNIAAEYRALAEGQRPSFNRSAACGTALQVENPQQLANAAASEDDPLAMRPSGQRTDPD